jgi:hypothetical protein
MMNFKDWLIAKESSASTRARNAAALGLMPLAVVGSINGRSTASPFELESITKKNKSNKKKKHKKKKHKKNKNKKG